MMSKLLTFVMASYVMPNDAMPNFQQHSYTQQTPFVVVPRMNRPDFAVIEGNYRCRYSDVNLKLALTGPTVRVTEYSDANGPASPDELSQWNAWLSEIKDYHTFGVACQGAEAVVVYVYEPNPQRLRDAPYVAVFWDGGEIKRLPFTPGPPGR